MRREIRDDSDIDAVKQAWGITGDSSAENGNHTPKTNTPTPVILSMADLYDTEFAEPEMLIENWIPKTGASLDVGPAKAGKTLNALQKAKAVAGGGPYLENYRVLYPGPVMFIEQDDPAGAASIKTVLQKSGAKRDLPIHVVQRLDMSFGPELLDWLEGQVVSKGLRLVVLDSYTSMRGSRKPGTDIVKAEQTELAQLDELAKRVGFAIELIHHTSKGSAGQDWSGQAAGSFAMSAATESQTHISRFKDLGGAATERLIRIRGRHFSDLEAVLRFRKETLDFELVLEGGASSMYPALLRLKKEFGDDTFTPKKLSHATGESIATANRQISVLLHSDAINRCGYGEYRISPMIGLR